MTHGARLLQWALWLCLLLSAATAAVQCDEIWTQAIRSNSPVPAVINYPAPNPSFPEPLQAGDYYYDNNANWQIPANTIRTTVAPTARLFINGNLTIGANSRLNDTGVAEHFILVVSGSVTIQSGTRINGFILAGGAITLTDNVQIQGGITAKGALANFGATVQFDANALTRLQGGGLCSATLGCQTDNFSDGLLSEDWVTSRSSGTFTPAIVNGRLRLTQAVGNQSTSVTFQRLFPAADNLVIIEFDYFGWSPASGQGADGIAVILSDASVTPQPGAFGGSLGYAQKGPGTDCPNCPGFAGGWLGIGLDEWGNFSNPTEGRVGGPGFRRNAISIRGAQANQYRYLAGTAAGLSPPIDQRPSNTAAPGHRYRIVIDSRLSGQALVSVARDVRAGAGFQNLVEPFNALAQPGQGAVPENFFLSFTGSTGGSNNNHELDNVSICALRSLPVGVQIDHFEFDHSGQALTCQPETLTVRACLNADCSQLYTEPVTATLSPQLVPTGEWLGGHTINFSGGSTTVQLRRSTPGSVTVGVSGSVPGTRPLSTTLCRAGSGPKNTTSCTLNYASSGFVLEIPDGIANQPDSDVRLRAVRQSDATQACVPAFSDVTRTVQLWSDYITPDASSRPVSWPILVNEQAVSLSGTSPSSQVLTFNAAGEAVLQVNYADAGRVQLTARYQGSAATEDAGLVLQGAGQFSKRPYGLCVQTAADCAAGNASCPMFARAGESFPVVVSAHAWQDGAAAVCAMPVTPNFNLAGIALEHELLAPVDGIPGQLQPASYQHQRGLTGSTQIDALLTEVGVFRLTARPAPLSYLGMTIPPASSQPVGRITPDHFTLLYADITSGCSGFSYMGQEMDWSLDLQARAVSGQPTFNYVGDFARAAVQSDFVAENANNGVVLSNRLEPAGPTLQWLSGEASWQQTVVFGRSPTLDGPFQMMQFGLDFVDGDGIGLSGLDMNPGTSSDCALLGECSAIRLAGMQDIRYGRLALESAFGPEDEPLPLAFRAEYWDGERFVHNAADHCTQVTKTEDSLTTVEGPSTLSLDGVGGLLENGRFPAQTLYLNPPGLVNYWIIEYRVDPWLRDGGVNLDQNPQAEVFFGRYRGNPRRIYWREPLP